MFLLSHLLLQNGSILPLFSKFNLPFVLLVGPIPVEGVFPVGASLQLLNLLFPVGTDGRLGAWWQSISICLLHWLVYVGEILLGCLDHL